jgi:methionyl-tRNA synthetase
MTEVSFDEWKKLDLRVGKILEVENHPNADKLLVMKVDIGEENPRTIVAGLKKYYSLEDLKGQEVVIFTNLEPVDLRGIKSEGMVLAAGKDDKVVFISPKKTIEVGARIS